MQGTIDIIAMLQKSNSIKRNFAASSIGKGIEKASFKDELSEARRSTTAKNTENNTGDLASNTLVKDNKIEKMAKAMSSSKVTGEKVEAQYEEETSSDQKLTEGKTAPKTQEDAQTAEKTEGKTEVNVDEKLEEIFLSAQELLQQLLQLVNKAATNDAAANEATANEATANEAAPENVEQIESSLQAETQKLEQILMQVSDVKTVEGETNLKDLKVELKELLKQLKSELSQAKAFETVKPNLQQTVNALKQLINKMDEIKPMLQQIQNKQETKQDRTEQKPELETSQNLDFKKDNKPAAENKLPEDNIKLEAASKSEAKDGMENDNKNNDNKNNDSKEDESESKYKANTKEASKQAVYLDEHRPKDLKLMNTLHSKQSEPQIIFKEINLNQKKEQIVAVNKSDIVNQVIKKADIILREGHSEMVMKLEPESLGKLNLKIVVEKGLITAKFIAESQQVKEVLESSFNQLKDALQEKGIAVQSFSVSVGQQTSDTSSKQSFNQWKQSLKIKNKTAGEFIGFDDEAIVGQNPYNYHEGKFDYRA